MKPLTPPVNTETSTPIVKGAAASKNLPDDTIDTGKLIKTAGDVVNAEVIGAPAALLQQTPLIKGIAHAADNHNVAANTAIGSLQKLAIGLQAVQSFTGGLYEAPAGTQPTNYDLLDTGLSDFSKAVGTAANIYGIGEAVTAIPKVGEGIEGLTNIVKEFPLVGKYLSRYVAPLAANTAGMAVNAQLDPNLGTNLQARGVQLLKSIGEAPIYTALGSIKNSGISNIGSFILGFGSAKLAGADNKTAVVSGLSFSLLDAFARAGGERPTKTAEEAQAELEADALKTLNEYSPIKLTIDSPLADLKAAYYKGVHQTHPDIGGTAEQFSRVQSAFDLLSKGTSAPEGEKSVATLKGDVSKVVAAHGPEVAKQALTERLGVDQETANKIVTGSQVPSTNAEEQAAHEAVLANVLNKRTDEQITTQSNAYVDKNLDKLVDDYLGKHVNIVGADEAKEFVPGYSQDRSTSDLVQKAAAKISEAAYNKLLDTKQGTGNNVVLITAGGTGAGKSTSIKELNTKDYPVVFDTNLSNAKGGIDRIQRALDNGYYVDLRLTYADISKAYDRVLDRAEQQRIEKGSGRPVSAQGHLDMHHGSHDALPAIIERFKDNPRVRITLYDNSGMAPKQIDNALDFINNVRNNREDEGKLHTQLNGQRELAHHEGRLSDKTNAGFDRAEALRPRRQAEGQGVSDSIQESGKKAALNRLKSPGGFIDVGAAATDIAAGAKKVKEIVDHLEDVRDLTGDVREGIYQHENARKALRIRLTKLIEQVGDTLDAQGWETLYHYDENNNEPITPEQREVYDQVISPLKEALNKTVTEYRAQGGTITSELFFMDQDEYTPRFAKDKQSSLDKLLEQGKKLVKSIQNGGLLSKSLGTVAKTRKFYAATDASGKRTVVYVPTDKSETVLGFTKGKINELGPVKGGRTPKVTEFFDDSVMRKLNTLAETLGIKHVRQIGKVAGKPSAAGVSYSPGDLILTRLSPSSVLAHEIGHQIDAKYGLQAIIKDDKYGAEHKSEILDEMRALADMRFGDMEVNDAFKKYVRKGSEKVAVMFEAYVANREMFRSVAPHLYDDFRDFLASHDELKPFLDIQPSVQLGTQKHGGEQFGKIGQKFVDAAGKKYTLGQATTREIEANTKTEYHKNALANYVVALDRAQNALNAMRLLERLKDEAVFGNILKKDSPDEAPPDGWKSVSDKLPQFRGYHMEPRLAEALTDLASRQQGQLYLPVIDELNNLLTGAIVFNPIMHVPNVLSGRAMAAAAGDVSAKSLENLGKAFSEVRNKGPLYLEYLEHGAPFMNLKETTRGFADAIFNQYTDELEKDPEEARNLAKILGYDIPAKLIHGFRNINEGITWGSNDMFFMHALLDYRDSHGGTMEEAIRDVSKRMADYRIPERIILPGQLGRALSVAMQSRFFLFGRFHYTGVIKPWLESARDGATGTAQERIAGIRALAYLLIMGLAVWPYINKMWLGITGSHTTYETMPGPLKPIQVGEKLATQGVEGLPAALQSIASVNPVVYAAMELGYNTDLFTRNPIYGHLPAEGLPALGLSAISPLSAADRLTPEDFALSLLGVNTPKNPDAVNTLNQMKYDELPALQVAVKKQIAAGDQKDASAAMLDYNNRAIAAWNMYQQEIDGTEYLTTDALKAAFLKEWGIKEPGAVAQANAAAHYGDGSLTNKSSLLDTVVTYAKALGVSPTESFHLMFSGQTIARVTNFGFFDNDSAIIVNRAPLSYTEPIKQQQESDKGLTDQNSTLELDHVVPLEAGGTNDKDNLNLVTTQQNQVTQHAFEDYLGTAVKAGEMSQAKVREYAIRYKVGLGETLPPAMMEEFTTKYGGKPITLEEVKSEVNAGKAR